MKIYKKKSLAKIRVFKKIPGENHDFIKIYFKRLLVKIFMRIFLYYCMDLQKNVIEGQLEKFLKITFLGFYTSYLKSGIILIDVDLTLKDFYEHFLSTYIKCGRGIYRCLETHL